MSLLQKIWNKYGASMTRYENICHGLHFHLNPITENKIMIFVAFRASYQGITQGLSNGI